jgi:very-short-patch-repair endonuclease
MPRNPVTARQIDQAAAALARGQHGVFSRRQLYAAGASAKIIRARLASGLWVQMAPDVFAVTSHPGTWKRQLMAAVLGERDAIVFGVPAAAVHGLEGFRPGHPEVVVARRSAHVSTLARVHQSDAFRGTKVDGIPVLTVPETFVALASIVPPHRLRPAFEAAVIDRTLTVGSMQRRLLDFLGSRRPGLAHLKSLVDEYSSEELIVPESVLEVALYAILGRPGMPPYRRQQPLPWAPEQRADAMLSTAPVIVEADGRRWHTRIADLARDLRRDRLATSHGHATLRYTYAELTADADGVAAEIRVVHDRLRVGTCR